MKTFFKIIIINVIGNAQQHEAQMYKPYIICDYYLLIISYLMNATWMGVVTLIAVGGRGERERIVKKVKNTLVKI
jgi:hypothetical protein